MGPRLQERGVRAARKTFARFHVKLQWGRAYKSAELTLQLWNYSSRHFNGAALTRARSWQGQVVRPLLLRRFNGAALTRARS